MDTPESSLVGPCSWPDGVQRINSFALVGYIPDPLARFLDDLRRELVPGCLPRAHVTILPPRPILAEVSEAWQHVAAIMRELPPVEVELGSVEVFGLTSVVYIGLAAGREQLAEMHDRLNRGPVEFSEPYVYHPHVTLAQQFPPELVGAVTEAARRRWETFRGPRHFTAETITFVQNTLQNRWLDLAELRLGEVPSYR